MKLPRGQAYLIALAVVVVIAFSITVATSGETGTQSAADESTVSSSSPPSSSPSASSKSSAPNKPKSQSGPNFEIKALKSGEKPPQFIIFSFDGAGSHQKWLTFSATAKKVKAQFTGFLTGLYLLDDAHKSAYVGPGHAAGKSSVGFGGTKDEVYQMINDLNKAKAAGHEIGTHFNGHFCAGAEPSANKWDAAAWNSELDQFFSFLTNYAQINGYTDAPKLTVTPADIQGERTPCLEGDSDQYFPALLAHNMRYDTSKVSNGIQWPTLINGVWEFWMPSVTVPALGTKVIAMDYNFWYKFNKAKDEPGRAPEFTKMVLDTYQSMYAAALNGNRAPLVIGNHFNNWSGNAFNPAVDAFMAAACNKPETVCTTYQNVLKWMAVQDPAILAGLLAQPPTAN
ncbi:polysaccharide deacetylase [Antricoccus suffuscus]|nr:polysaccharide deacetylase [Antricoccus suffuscus]